MSVLPGLLQTPEYARELLAAGGYKGEEMEKQLKARMGRRELLDGEDAPPFRTILSEAVLRDAAHCREQLEYLADIAERPNVSIQVLKLGSGIHGLVSTDVMFLRLLGGRTVAYTENAHQGELVEENVSVERLQRAYDALRDLALPPAESRKFILRMLEEVPCDPSI